MPGKKKRGIHLFFLELAGLIVMSVIFGLRVFYIHFPFIELIFCAAGLLLAFIYLRKLIVRYQHFRLKNVYMARLVLVFHLSILLFLASLALLPFYPKAAEMIGAVALVLLLGFFIAGALKQDLLVDGNKLSAFAMVRHLRDHSIIIVSLLLLFSFYFLFNKVGFLPGIYSDEFPRAYFKLVDDASSKKEKPVDGRYRHEEFMDKYKQFLKNQQGDKQ